MPQGHPDLCTKAISSWALARGLELCHCVVRGSVAADRQMT